MTAKEREAFEVLRDAGISMLNLEMAAHIAAKYEVCKGLDVRYHTNKMRAALAKAEALEVTHE